MTSCSDVAGSQHFGGTCCPESESSKGLPKPWQPTVSLNGFIALESTTRIFIAMTQVSCLSFTADNASHSYKINGNTCLPILIFSVW